MPSYISLELSGQEALFLCQLLNIPEAVELCADAIPPEAGGSPDPWADIQSALAADAVIEVDGNDISLHPDVNRILQGCKLSSGVGKLYTRSDEGELVSLYYLSSVSLTEMSWNRARNKVQITAFEHMEDMFRIIGEHLNPSDEPAPDLKASIRTDILQQLAHLPGEADLQRIRSLLAQDPGMPDGTASALAAAYRSRSVTGQFAVFLRGSAKSPARQSIRFVTSQRGNWMFLNTSDSLQTAVFPVTGEELVQSLFLLTLETLRAA